MVQIDWYFGMALYGMVDPSLRSTGEELCYGTYGMNHDCDIVMLYYECGILMPLWEERVADERGPIIFSWRAIFFGCRDDNYALIPPPHRVLWGGGRVVKHK